jgi:CheY-like chemotaxis protein
MLESKSKLILCADDDKDDRDMLCETIQQLQPDYIVEPTGNGEELLSKLEELILQKKKPCLIILDINMPKKDGKATVIEIKTNPEWSDIPVAILTTSERYVYADLELKYNVPIVTKPTSLSTLKQQVTKLLQHCL